MADPRVTEILRLCEEALAREGPERAAYLDTACRGDRELRREVDALLAQDSTPAAFVETPAWMPHRRRLGARPGPQAQARLTETPVGTPVRSRLAPGTRLGPYQIIEKLGEGGMGEVYKARDPRLDRSVAIKIRPPEISADPDPSASSGSSRAKSRDDRRVRFEREATTIGGLDHPHRSRLAMTRAGCSWEESTSPAGRWRSGWRGGHCRSALMRSTRTCCHPTRLSSSQKET